MIIYEYYYIEDEVMRTRREKPSKTSIIIKKTLLSVHAD
jgi:hypothetical protein